MTLALPHEPMQPISLGFACEVKYQLSRVLYFRKLLSSNDRGFRMAILTSDFGETRFERHVFDWQITPFDAARAYLRSDFTGVFERDDLTLIDEGAGPEVVHRRLLTRHPHEFPCRDGQLTEAILDETYPRARSKFDYLANKFRDHLRQPGPFLYVCKEVRSQAEIEDLIALLSAGSPEHRFHLLVVGQAGEPDHDLSALKDQVTKAILPPAIDKPIGRDWEGDDAAWSAVFEPFALVMDPGEILLSTGVELAPAPVPPAHPRRSLFSRIARR
jgi:hypothetical protein